MTNNGRVGSESPPTVHRTSFDPDTESASDAVEAALDAVTNENGETVDSIDSIVDPIVFDALVRRARAPIGVTFDMGGYEVTVESSGEIAIRTIEADVGSDQAYRFEDEPASEAVVRAVAEFKGVGPVEIEPLYDVVDPEALDAVVEGADRIREPACSVSFRIEDVHVRVSTDRRVYVRPMAAEPDA